jgi:Ca2+-binding EF-hand superfamily protein
MKPALIIATALIPVLGASTTLAYEIQLVDLDRDAFVQMDEDANGQLSAEELEGYSINAPVVTMGDTELDGHELPHSCLGEMTEGEFLPLDNADLLRDWDHNGNGQISFEEMWFGQRMDAQTQFLALDADNDLRLTPVEFLSAVAMGETEFEEQTSEALPQDCADMIAEMGVAQGEILFTAIDANQDGTLDVVEFLGNDL